MKPKHALLLPIFAMLLQSAIAQPTAGFTYSVNCNDVVFINTSSNAVTYAWDFGDGDTSSLQNPAHTYLGSGSYTVSLTASDGLGGMDTATSILAIPLNQINSTMILQDVSCFLACDGWAVASVSGGSPPYSFNWSDGSTDSIAQNLCAGLHSVTISDINNCFAVNAGTTHEPPQLLINDSIVNDSCNTCMGRILVSVFGGIGAYSFLWSDSSITPVLTGVCPGSYSVTVHDAANCVTVADSLIVVSSCFDTISGTVYNDLNSNCIQDTGELGIPNVLIDITPGGGSYTDTNGNYMFIRDTGTFIIEQVLPQYHNQLCPSSPNSYTVAFNSIGQHSSGNNFSNEIIPVQELRASLSCGVVRPGFQSDISFAVHNAGTIPVSGYAVLSLDSRLTFLNSISPTPAPNSINTLNNMIYWNFGNLGINQSLNFSMNVQVPSFPIVWNGDTIISGITIFPLVGDTNNANNTSICNTVARSSYDPNDKAVSPEGEGVEGNITQDDTLMYYTIRFQNTGTDTAFTVVIKDTLDSNLDLRTLKQGTASHPYTVHFEEDDIVVFTFENIQLPDSNVNEAASHGHVTYYIEHKGTLPIGATISNRAAIYFDFNAPVITNTVSNKIYDPVGVNEVFVAGDITIYPNPAQDLLTIEGTNSTVQQIFVMDIFGKRVFDSGRLNTLQHSIKLNIPNGIYLLQVKTDKGYRVKKLVIGK